MKNIRITVPRTGLEQGSSPNFNQLCYGGGDKNLEAVQREMMGSGFVGPNRSLADVNLLRRGVFIWLWYSASYVNKHVKASKFFHISLS
jgi:hypothetical protein